jgi:hypothetical protein
MKCYFLDHGRVNNTDDVSVIMKEIEDINPDILIGLCMEEFDYHYIFRNVFPPLLEYLTRTNKTFTLIAPFIHPKPVSPTIKIEETQTLSSSPYQRGNPKVGRKVSPRIIVEDSYGYTHWGYHTMTLVLKQGLEFNFNDDTVLFTSYNHTGKLHRSVLVDELAKHDLLKDGIVTLHTPYFGPIDKQHTYKHHDGSKLIDEEGYVINASSEFEPAALPRNYLRGFIDIVSESSYGPGEAFMSEKTVKPIATLKPFLVVGAKHMHKHLREKYSLEEYPELFDYSFDEEDDLELRVQGVVNNLVRLRNMPIDELKSIYHSIQDKLLRNRNVYSTVMDDLDKFTPTSIKKVLDPSIEWYGDVNASILYTVCYEKKLRPRP